MTTYSAANRKGHLTAAFGETVTDTLGSGLQKFEPDDEKETLIYIPAGYQKTNPAPLALMLHGSGGTAKQALSLLQPYAGKNNIILLAPASRAYTWDIISEKSFGADVAFIDELTTFIFKHYAIDPARIAIGGFSDGASYALSLGLSNGHLFTDILAFSPGFVYTVETKGFPAIYVSHGTKDPVLPLSQCSNRIVPTLRQQGFNVNYQVFDGGHEVPSVISAGSVRSFIDKQ
jgi:phospholipase/carboxylesterase